MSRQEILREGGERNHHYSRNKIFFLGNYLFSTSYDRTARCWDLRTGICLRIFAGHNHGLLPIAFLPSKHETGGENDFENEMNIYTRDLVITGSQDTTAKIWSFESGECLKTLEGHIGAILCLATDALGKILFTGSGDNSIRVWDIKRGEELRIYDQHQAPIINLLVRKRTRWIDLIICCIGDEQITLFH